MKIICIMGAPAIGKTYISTKLAKEIGVTSLVNTDMIRAVARKYAQENENKELFMAAILASDLSDDDLNKEIYGFKRQAEILKSGVEASLRCLDKEEVDLVIIEGIHILPNMIPELSQKYEMLPLLFKLDDEEIHFHRMRLQGEERSTYKLLHKDRARAFQQYLIEESNLYHVELIENLEEKEVMKQIIELSKSNGFIDV